MTKLSRLVPCLALGLATSSAWAQMFIYGGFADSSVKPGTPFSAEFHSGYPMFTQDGSQPGSTSGSALFTATGVSAVGSASGSYSAASGWSGLSFSAHSASSYPAVAPNIDEFSFSHAAKGYAHASAYYIVDDLVFSGPTAAIPVSLNLLFSSVMDARASSRQALSSVSCSIRIDLDDDLDDIPLISGSDAGDYRFNVRRPNDATGLLGSYAGGLVNLQSGVWAVPTGTSLRLFIALEGDASSSGFYGSSSDGDATVTLALPTGVPLFNLPAGFSADSPSMGLVNNIYSPVPEPGHYAAFAGLGLLGFAFWRRARR